MKPDEAIKHLDDCMSETERILWPECYEAHKLGIEALKYRKDCRAHDRVWMGDLLPGETEE